VALVVTAALVVVAQAAPELAQPRLVQAQVLRAGTLAVSETLVTQAMPALVGVAELVVLGQLVCLHLRMVVSEVWVYLTTSQGLTYFTVEVVVVLMQVAVIRLQAVTVVVELVWVQARA
jgi:hypothetical protein